VGGGARPARVAGLREEKEKQAKQAFGQE